MRKLVNVFLKSILIIFLLNSCASAGKIASYITIDSGEIPPEMKDNKFILIGILTGDKNYDKQVSKKYNDYSGEYLLMTKKEMSENYSDVDKYRYYMHFEQEVGVTATGEGTCGMRYHIFDRKEQILYNRRRRSGFFALEMESYLLAIDRVRGVKID
jgi:polysaccharide pyruvyl transferase WcaK-like protein